MIPLAAINQLAAVYRGRGRNEAYLEFAQEHFLDWLGHADGWAPDPDGQGDPEFVMRALEVTYEAPARFDDLLEVFVRTTRIGRTSVTCEGAAYRVDDDVLMCTTRMTLVLIDATTRRPTPIPSEYRRAIAAFEGVAVEIAQVSGF